MSRLNSFLRGIRVLDLSRHLPGPLTTLFMADMGAEVIKIEAPDGDELRAVRPQDSEGRSVYFQAINAGKSTRRVDLKKPEDRAEFFRLVRLWPPSTIEVVGSFAATHRVNCRRCFPPSLKASCPAHATP